MPNPKKRTTRGKRGSRRSHDGLATPPTCICSECGEVKRPHNICPQCGSYKGKTVVEHDDTL
ncbi:MAG: 50S ribosomal protein L32 [Proteobacteria bacterium]|nr:50S ribosomal protein L32 [Pseudomonadota bacterium]